MPGVGAFHLFNGGALATQLDLSGLAPHTTLTVTFHLLQWDSIDWEADTFQHAVDGAFAYNGAFGNYKAPGACTFGCIAGPAGISTLLTPQGSGDFANRQLGENPSFLDSLHLVTFTVPHTAATASFGWRYPNTLGAPDEAFGIDNIVIATNAVPEPSTIWRAAAGLGVLATYRRKR